MKVKASLLALAVAFATTGASPGELTSVLDWRSDPSNALGSITDVTVGGSDIDLTNGGPLISISDGVFDPAVSIAQQQFYSYLTNTQVETNGAGPTDPIPVIVFDLGADTVISGYQIWNYRDASNDAHMLKDFRLRFATDAEGTGGFGTSIGNIETDVPDDTNDTGYRAITAVTARYIEFSLLSRQDGKRVGVEEIQFDLSAVGGPSTDLALADFSYDPGDGSAEVSITGAANTNYKLVEADDLDFSNPDLDPIPLTGASVGTLDGNEVTTDGSGNATVQFNLGTAKSATFLRAEEVPE